jgi:hypothetical protein
MENDKPVAGWTYKPGSNEAQQPEESQVVEQTESQANVAQQSVNWTASEFVSNHKDARWYAGYILVFSIILVLIFVFTKDIISVAVIAIAAFLFLVMANKKPRQMSYEVNYKGIIIGNKFHNYEKFKSFSLSNEEAVGCINFLPLHRFMPEISIYFPPEEGDKIIDILTQHIANDQSQEKKIDSMFKKFRF